MHNQSIHTTPLPTGEGQGGGACRVCRACRAFVFANASAPSCLMCPYGSSRRWMV